MASSPSPSPSPSHSSPLPSLPPNPNPNSDHPRQNDETTLTSNSLTQNSDSTFTLPPPPKRPRGRLPSKGSSLQRSDSSPKPCKELVRLSISSPNDGHISKILVRKVRIAYDSLRCHFHLQNPNKTLKSKQTTRYDMHAYSHIKTLSMISFLNPEKRIVGPVPGVQIGDVFLYRAEISLLGLHTQLVAGINFAPAGFTEANEPIAISVVASGGYQGDEELQEGVLLYTGSGGKGRNNIHISSDQTLERGNLALERSLQYGIEIRVIYGIPHSDSPSGMLYIYDGLYRVVSYKQEKQPGSSSKIFRFKLVRIEGQIESGIKLVRIAKEIKGKLNEGTVPAGYLCEDISNGKEKIPVPFFNDIDKGFLPMVLDYVKSPKYPSPSIKSAFKGCKCKKFCSVNCICRERNGGSFAYDNNGVLLQGRPIVYECGDTCQCPIGCQNRVTQKGIRYKLEVFRSQKGHYGVRSLDPIQAGTFICEFSGDFLLKEVVPLNVLPFSSSLIDPTYFPERWREWGDLSEVLRDWKMTDLPLLVERPEYLLDVSRRGNMSGFIGNYRDYPNLFVQYVLYGHDNVRFPRMMLFALENIPPLRELYLDYGF